MSPEAERGHRRDTLLTTAVGFAAYGLAVLSGPVLARALGAAGRGSYQAVWAPVQLLGWALMLGLPQATAYYAKEHDRRSLDATAWLAAVLVGVPVVALIWLLAPAFLAQHPPATVPWFRAYLVSALLVLPMQNSYEWLRAAGRTLTFNLYRALPFVLSTAGLVLLSSLGALNLASALWATLAANVVAPLTVLVLERSNPLAMPSTFSRAAARRQLHYGGRVWVGTLSNMVTSRFDQFLMVSLVSPDQLGQYAVAVTAAGLSAPIAQGVGFSLFPHLRAEADPARRQARTRRALAWVAAASALIGGALALGGRWGLTTLMGPSFSGALVACWILLPGQACWNLGQVVKARLEADDRPGAASHALAAAALVTIVGVPLAVRFFGIEGAAAVTTLSQVVFLAWATAALRRAGRPGHHAPRREGGRVAWAAMADHVDEAGEAAVHVEVKPLAEWPDDKVRRAYRLLVGAVRQLTLSGAANAEIDDARLDAELFGVELVRRKLL
ncbi:MAG: lipopolysaccharide biosynthesis protein [Acidimicrobiales bacterium]